MKRPYGQEASASNFTSAHSAVQIMVTHEAGGGTLFIVFSMNGFSVDMF